jgi:hypothetical protein
MHFQISKFLSAVMKVEDVRRLKFYHAQKKSITQNLQGFQVAKKRKNNFRAWF